MKNFNLKLGMVILHWNGFDLTEQCLKSLEKTEFENKIIYIVDNNSTNDSLERLKQKYPQYEYIELKKNIGFAGGMNAGTKKAISDGCQAVFLLSNDTIIERSCPRILSKRLFSKKNIAAATPMVYQGKSGRLIGSIGGKINWSNGESIQIGHNKKDNGNYQSQKTEFIPGSAFMVKSSAVKKAGLMPEEYFLYNEDSAWSLEFRRAGFELWTEPRAILWHDESSSSGKNSPLKTYYYVRNMLIFIRKYSRPYSKRRIKAILGFDWKYFKMITKFIAKREFDLLKASSVGYGDYLKKISGESEKYSPKLK